MSLPDTPRGHTPQAQHGAETERTLYKAIVAHKRAHDGNSPSLRDLQVACGISSTSVISAALKRLAKTGLIELENGSARSIRVDGGKWELDS